MSEAIFERGLQALAPSTRYAVRVRAWNKLGVSSDWSEALDFTTIGDNTVPGAPTGLIINFATSTLLLSWTPPTINADGSPITDLMTYQVSLTANAKTVTYEAPSQSFAYTIEQNGQDFGTPQSTINISIVAVDISGHHSAPLTGVAIAGQGGSGGTLTTPSGLTVYAGLQELLLTWTPETSGSLDHYEIHVGTSPGFVTSLTTLFGTAAASDTLISINKYYNTGAWVPLVVSPPTTYYIKMYAVSVWGAKSSASVEVSGTPLAVSNNDIIANTINGSVIITNSLVADKIATGTLTANVTVTGFLQAGSGSNYVQLGVNGLTVVNAGQTLLSALVSGVTLAGGVTVTSTQMQSSNWINGSTGWAINEAGSAQFNGNVTVSGIIKASSFQGSGIIGGGTGGANSDNLASSNWNGIDSGAINGTTGWAIYASGNAYFNSVFLRGTISATSGTIGGWTIGTTTLTGGGVTLDSSAGSITGGTIQTATSGQRVVISGASNLIDLYSGMTGEINPGQVSGGFTTIGGSGVYNGNLVLISPTSSSAPLAAQVNLISVASGNPSVTVQGDVSMTAYTLHANVLQGSLDGSWVTGAVANATNATNAATASGLVYGSYTVYSINANGTGGGVAGSQLFITGAKTFTIKHPVRPNYKLRFSSIEGPRADLIYRGRIQLQKGQASVDLDSHYSMTEGTFDALNQLDTRQIFLYNETGDKNPKGQLNKNVLNITCDDHEAWIGWMVVTERGDSDIRRSEATSNSGRILNEFKD